MPCHFSGSGRSDFVSTRIFSGAIESSPRFDAVSFRVDSLRSGTASSPRAGVIDHRLARRALITEYRKGRLAKHQVCDAHPELLRAARGIGRETTTECPICEDDVLVHVTADEVVAFGEPREYLPRRPFYEQFAGRGGEGKAPLDRDLKLVAGATLTTQATIAACQRVLAVHRALQMQTGQMQTGQAQGGAEEKAGAKDGAKGQGNEKGNEKGGDQGKPPTPPAQGRETPGGGEEHR